MTNPVIKPVDPLLNGPEAEVELYKRIVPHCHGFPNDAVWSAGLNLVINSVRKVPEITSREKALDLYDMVVVKGREALANHYHTNGARRSIFPFDQVIRMERISFKKM